MLLWNLSKAHLLRRYFTFPICAKNKATLTSKQAKTKAMTARAPPAAVDVLVVAGGRRDTASCVLVNTDYSTYLINCPEGAQRILTDIGGAKFSRLEHIFLTTNRWRSGGGLLGMALTLQTAGSKRLAIHGPQNCDKILTLARNFTTEKDELKLEIEPCCSTETKDFDSMFSDDSITVGCVPLRPNYESGSDSPKRSRQSPTFGDTALAFIMKPKPKNRRVDMNKCIKIGLPRGPAIGQLVRGEDVTLPDGRVIKPDDVLDDPLPSRPVLFVDCPNASYLKSLTENPVISQMMKHDGSEASKEECIQLVVHMSPFDIFNSPSYQEWLQKFPTSATDHLVLNESCGHVAHERIYRMQAQLNILDDVIFKLLDDQLPETSAVANKSPLDDENVKTLPSGRSIVGGTGLSYNCRQGAFQASVKGFPIQLDNDEFCSEVHSTEESKDFEESLAAYRERTKSLRPINRTFPKILFLGTASAVPGKRRNSSGILLLLESKIKKNAHSGSNIRYVLIDCAEGTTGQFLRYFGLGKSGDEALTALDMVLLSHRHADHHMGLLGMIYERRKAFERLGMEYEPLVVLVPRYQIGNWLKAYSSALDSNVISHLVKLVEAERVADDDFSDEVYSDCLKAVGLEKVESVPVRHCRNALGYVVTAQTGFKVTYSGDTMPCDALVQVGRGCDVLIHEATFDDDLVEEAVAKRHSTTSQAVDIGRRMGAKMTMLTHFSQRYETLPHLPDEFLAMPPKQPVGIAFDNMLVSADDLPLLPHMFPVLRHMFAGKLEALDEIKQKRSLRKEREMAKLSSLVSSVQK